MADKNRAGTKVFNSKKQEDRMISDIDYREKTGKNKENVDDSYNTFTVIEDGSKVWSF
jgi:hypothetical protein